MTVKTLIKHGEYHDSVSLMAIAQELAHLPGINDAAVVMATEANKGILQNAGLLTSQAQAASPNDLVIAVEGEDSSLNSALEQVEKLLSKKTESTQTNEHRPKTLRSAFKAFPQANLAVISVAGRYAAAEAWDALRLGLHVLLFSDNVSLEDEIALKQYASQHGLLLMGPGAGTAILNGVALGFANVLPRGPVGIVSAAGTGLQEVSTLLARQGVGITQGIGTGGRDLKEQVGGIMMLDGLRALQADPATQVILLVSKPPSASVTEEVLDQIAQGGKSVVVCFLGADPRLVQVVPNAVPARTLQEAAMLVARLAGGGLVEPAQILADEEALLKNQAEVLRRKLKREQRWLRGLYSGGTLCYEAQVIWRGRLHVPVFSNAPLDDANRLSDSNLSHEHCALDLGEEEFTVGRPHPMINNDLRIRRLLHEAQDPEVAVILFDVVLGYGAHPDPAGELGTAVVKAQNSAKGSGREIVFIASVTGTEADPQGFSRQVQKLVEAGVKVCSSNSAAARLAALVVENEGI